MSPIIFFLLLLFLFSFSSCFSIFLPIFLLVYKAFSLFFRLFLFLYFYSFFLLLIITFYLKFSAFLSLFRVIDELKKRKSRTIWNRLFWPCLKGQIHEILVLATVVPYLGSPHLFISTFICIGIRLNLLLRV